MAVKGLYAIFKQRLLNKEIDQDTDVIKALLIRTVAGPGAAGNTVYTPVLATDDDLADIPNNVYCRVGAAVTVTVSSIASGIVNVGNITFPTVPAGDAIQGVALYDDTHATKALILFTDTETGFPITPNGTNIVVQIDTGANKLFAL